MDGWNEVRNVPIPVIYYYNFTDSDYMKMVVCLPSGRCEEDRRLAIWLTTKLSVGSVPSNSSTTCATDEVSALVHCG